MLDISFVREKFASLSTERLMEILVTEERLPRVEELLREELIGRGIPEQLLMSAVIHRESITKRLEDERAFGRWLLVSGAVASFGVAGILTFSDAMGGEHGKMWAGVLLSAAYCVALARMMFLARHELLATRDIKVALWFLLQATFAVGVLGTCIYQLLAKP